LRFFSPTTSRSSRSALLRSIHRHRSSSTFKASEHRQAIRLHRRHRLLGPSEASPAYAPNRGSDPSSILSSLGSNHTLPCVSVAGVCVEVRALG
jgi:hypothetical protein